MGEGVSELRGNIGSGYRVYYGKHGQTLVAEQAAISREALYRSGSPNIERHDP